MPTAPVAHHCYPLWTAPGSPPIATCTRHFGQPVGVTAAPTPAAR